MGKLPPLTITVRIRKERFKALELRLKYLEERVQVLENRLAGREPVRQPFTPETPATSQRKR